MSKKILIIGATGLLGKPVAEHFNNSDYEVRLLVRNIEKANKIFGSGFEKIPGNVTDKESLDLAVKDCSAVYVSLSGEVEQTGVENVVKAAKGKNIERIAYISGTSVAEENTWYPMIKRKYLAERAIIKSGIPYTIFRPAWFMESLQNFVRDGKAFVFGHQRKPYHFVAAEDYARMVVNAFSDERARNKIFYIHGPEGILFAEAVRRYVEALHPELRKVNVLPHWMANMIAVLSKNQEMRWGNDFMKYYAKVGDLGDPTEANEILGAPKITLDEWLEKKKSAV